MYEKIQAMFEGGDLDRMLRIAKVRREHFDDFRSYVILRLLTHRGKVEDWKAYAFGFIRREYHSRRSQWWKEQGRWDASRVGLSGIGREIPVLDRYGDMGGEEAAGVEDVQGARLPGRAQADHLPARGGAGKDKRGGAAAQGTPKHHRQDIPQDREGDTR